MNFNLKSPSSYREWREYFLFRYKILRKPIGLHRSTIRDKLEKISYHVMATNNKGKIIGVGRLHFVNIKESQNMSAFIQANILTILHPFIPFFTEKNWQDFKFSNSFKTPLM